MPTYSVNAVNVASFPLGETDKVVTVFSAERGLIKCVAKGARKPGSKIGGRADLLNVNKLLLASGRTFEIISQAESLETFPQLRTNLERLSYSLYYAELTSIFGQGLNEEASEYFDFLVISLRFQSLSQSDPAYLCLMFELRLLDILGYMPELTVCVNCRTVLTDHAIAGFHYELGGMVCERCHLEGKRVRVGPRVAEDEGIYETPGVERLDKHVTPLVWKRLVSASAGSDVPNADKESEAVKQATRAAHRAIEGYIEHRAGRRIKSLELLNSTETSQTAH
ncbi:MAG: DNA repair protein RecO [Cyanobacteria bacterium DS2.3.42]|nr:DNA repair protein RecO [Cyanobacteria bacterium DS2.3.42]